MALLTVTTVSRAGAVLSGVAATATTGDAFPNTGKEFLVVNNGSGASIDVALKVRKTVDGQAVADRTVAVAAGAVRIIGPFPLDQYNDANARVTAICSAVTSVTVQAIACPGA
jgi:hypothetical protein